MHDPKPAAPAPAAEEPKAKPRAERTRPRPTDKASRAKWKHERAIALGDKPAPKA